MRFALSPLVALCISPLLMGWVGSPAFKPVEEKTFDSQVLSSSKAWKAKHYSACIKQLEFAIKLCKDEQDKLVYAVLPEAPAGWNTKPEGSGSDARWDVTGGIFSSLGVTTIGSIARDYENEKGDSTLRIRIMSESPLFSIVQMAVESGAMLEDHHELVPYHSNKALLAIKDGDVEMHIPFGEQGIAIVTLRNGDKQFLLDFFGQEVVKKIEAALAN